MIEDKDWMIEESTAAGQREIQQLREQLEDERKGRDSEILTLTKRISELELQLRVAKAQQSVASGGAECKTSINLKWKKGRNAPHEISNLRYGEMAAAVDENCMYVREDNIVFICNISTCTWSQLPDNECDGCALATINGLLTLIGGIIGGVGVTNRLLSLIRKWKIFKWTEEFPPM